MKTLRTHITSSKAIIPKGRNYAQQPLELKPNGLWYSINDEWLEWCFGNDLFDWIGDNRFELELDMSKILVISSVDELTMFNNEFEDKESRFRNIDWRLVAEKYSGIELINYYSYRMATVNRSIWHYSIDVNGGCIWDLSALKEVKKTDTPKEYLKK